MHLFKYIYLYGYNVILQDTHDNVTLEKGRNLLKNKISQ
jgi:hypothetical protein